MRGALAIYRGQPAVVEALEKDRLLLRLPQGVQRVRPKDIRLLHPGPAWLPLEPLRPNPKDLEEAHLLLQGQSVELRELAELLFGAYTPEAAYGAYLLVEEGELFAWEGERVRPRTPEEVAAQQAARAWREERRRAFEEGLERLRRGEADPNLLPEVKALVLGERRDSPVLRALGLPETPEEAHRLLLRLGVFRYENPHPRRLALPLTPPDLPLPPEEDFPRRDLTGLPAFAIDDEGNQDPDDAVWAERVGEGYRLLVHVADPGSAIRPGSPIDQEALRRGASLYLPEGMVPMLPGEAIARYGLGLRPVSPALTFDLLLDPEGELIEVQVYPSWVRVQRLAYREALDRPELQALAELAQAFRRRRLEAGGVEISLPEVKVRVEGERVQLIPLPPYESRIWVREAMLLAGYAAAHFALERGLPFPFATQEAPTREGGEGLAGMWALRKGLRRAQLKATPGPHRGLGLPLYAQVTSPLRRYLDLLAHQQLWAYFRGEKPLGQAEVLERVGAAEAVADLVREGERKSRLHWTLVYLLEEGYEGPGVLVERRGGQGVFFLPELGLTATIALPQDLPLNAKVRLRFLEADLAGLEARFTYAQ